MSTSDEQRPLTRREMRELGLAGSAPVPAEEASEAPAREEIREEPRELDLEIAEMALDPDAVPLTRRQARELERIRTASVPVVEPEESEAAAAEPEEASAKGEKRGRLRSLFASKAAVTEEPAVEEPAGSADEAVQDAVAEAAAAEESAVEAETSSDDVPAAEEDDAIRSLFASEAVAAVDEGPTEPEEPGKPEEPAESIEATESAPAEGAASVSPSVDDLDDLLESADEGDTVFAAERVQVNPDFGRTVLVEEVPDADLTASFDELIGSTEGRGSSHTASALILTQAPEASLAGPITSTGEILVTGSFELPEGLATHGHAHGTADGLDVDAVLLDREIPAASSPTPIAASAAVGTIKPAGEVIRPPAPEKGSRLMLALTITAGALAVAVATALIVAFTSGVF